MEKTAFCVPATSDGQDEKYVFFVRIQMDRQNKMRSLKSHQTMLKELVEIYTVSTYYRPLYCEIILV